MIQEYQLRVLPEIAANEQRLKEYLSEEKGLNLRNINATRILKRSIDARQRTIFVNLKIRVYINETPEEDEYEHTVYNSVEGKPQVIVVGACSTPATLDRAYLESLSFAELKRLANDMDVPVTKTTKKAELIDTLAAETVTVPAEADDTEPDFGED